MELLPVLDPDSCSVAAGTYIVSARLPSGKLLALLFSDDDVWLRDDILVACWQIPRDRITAHDVATLRVCVHNLRRKLADHAPWLEIHVRHGAGYEGVVRPERSAGSPGGGGGETSGTRLHVRQDGRAVRRAARAGVSSV